jgi:hypothetical protein
MNARHSATKACLLTIAAATAAAALGGSATPAPATAAATNLDGYGWPVAPFDQAHPVRAAVGDPRTIFRSRGSTDPLGGPGTFSFHNGVDIDAPNGTPIYPVLSGFVREVREEGVVAQADDGRLFMYMHIVPSVGLGARLTARQTVLGRVKNWAHELHFAELTSAGAAVNPLQPGHLTPYRDTTVPTVGRLHLRDPRGNRLAPFALRGRITLIAEAYDLPAAVPPRGSEAFRLSKFARDRFPVTPAVVTWSLSTVGGRAVVAPQTVVDFRRAIPSDESFWRVYARGTYQNRSVIGARMHWLLPGRFLFALTRSPLDTRRLANGVYVATVTAVDVSGNRSSLSERIEVWNARNAR